MDDCLFCKIISGDMPSQTVHEDDETLAFLDIHPLNPGHTLVISKAHSENFLKATTEEMQAVIRSAKDIAPAILKAVGAEACNVTTNAGRAAGQIVNHTHFHIIPRFAADGYEPWARSDDSHDDLASVAEKIREAQKS